MKKILSFLTKKPLALAAVALFSMSSFAQDVATPGAEGDATPEATAPTQKIWAKLTDSSLLKPFLKVTLVDEIQGKIYTVGEDGKQVEAEDYVPGSDASDNGDYLYVCEGVALTSASDDDTFSLNTQNDGKGTYINYLGSIESRVHDSQVTWLKDVSEGIFSEFDNRLFIFYDWDPVNKQGDKIFKTTPNKNKWQPAALYYEKEVGLPTFDPEEGAIQVFPDNPAKEIVITNPNKDADGNELGTLKYRVDGGDWTVYDGPVMIEGLDEQHTIEAKIVFSEGTDDQPAVETKVVGSNYVLYQLDPPTFDPNGGELKVDKDGLANVDIESEQDGVKLAYEYDDVKKTNQPNPSTVDLASYANPAEGETNEVTVKAKATKKVTYTPWTAEGEDPAEPVTEDKESAEVSATFNVVPNATPEDLFTDLKSEPENGAQVNGGQTVYLWFELLPDLTGDFANYEIEPNTEVAKKDLELTFKGKTEPVKAPASIVPLPGTKDKYVVSFVVPVGKDYVNTEFDVAVPEGFYKATSGKNVVLTEAGTVHYTTGLGAVPYYVEMPNMLLPTDATSVTVKIYPWGQKDAVVNFVDDKDPVKGVQFGNSIDELETPVEKIEKTGEPNTFTVTFTNKEGQNEFIQKWILNEDGQINEKGFVIGFPDNTFVSDDMANGDQISTHINFYEAIDFKIESEEWNLCEGSEDIVITVTGTGSLTGDEFDVQLVEGKIATITGTDWRGNAVSRKATISTLTPEVMDKHNIAADANTDNMYVVTFGEFKLPEDYGYIADDEDHPYTMTIPAGTFTSNNDTNEEVTKNVNIMAHPVWAVEAEPYTYDEGKNSASTITLKITATLDDTFFKGPDMDKKLYEKPLRVRDQEIEILVDGKAAEWELKNVVTDEMRTANGMLYQTGEIVLTLAEPIKDVEKHTIKINKGALKANACRNPEMIVDVYPYVEYGIEKAYYVVPTTQKSVPYSIFGKLPDGSYLPAGVIKYVGETENPEVTNAVAYNNQKVKPTDTDAVEYRFPTVASTKAGVAESDGKDVTVFTIEFTPGQLWVADFQMNFPVGTVQAKGYNANDRKLYNNFDVVPGMEYDATSSFADYMEPAKEDKQKEYRISTKDGSITLYLTAVDLTNPYDANANKAIELEEGTPLTIVNDEDGSEEGNSWVKVVDKKTGEISYTVTFEDGGLEEGVYTLTVPEETVAPLVLKDFTEGTPLGVKNPEAFELKIYVEDFAAPRHVQEITTKTWTFLVPNVKGLSKIAEDGPAITLDGKEVEAACDEEGVLTVTLPEVDGEYDFLPTGDYKLVIPAGAIEGKNTTNYNDLEVDVKVIYEFVDSRTGVVDDMDNDLVSTVADVNAETKVHNAMIYTRNFKNTQLQMLAVPFNIKQADVKEYFTIYRIDFARFDEATGKSALNCVKLGDDEIAYANRPYLIKAKSEGLVGIKLRNTEVVEPVENDDIQCSTTKTTFFFNTTTEDKEGKFLTKISEGDFGTATELPAWRWYITSADKEIDYIKLFVNGLADDADGIDFVEAAEGDNLIYNVAGQKLNTAAKGKVNIINGKKVFVK